MWLLRPSRTVALAALLVLPATAQALPDCREVFYPDGIASVENVTAPNYGAPVTLRVRYFCGVALSEGPQPTISNSDIVFNFTLSNWILSGCPYFTNTFVLGAIPGGVYNVRLRFSDPRYSCEQVAQISVAQGAGSVPAFNQYTLAALAATLLFGGVILLNRHQT